VALDCDLSTGAKIGGGTPTDNAAAINAVLATATATGPVHLIIDGGSAIGSPILIPPTGHVTISGRGWNDGLFVKAGSNCNAIQNFADTDLAIYQAWQPGGAQSIAGSNVTIRDLRIVGNRGTYPNGNVSATNNTDGTIDGTTAPLAVYGPDAR